MAVPPHLPACSREKLYLPSILVSTLHFSRCMWMAGERSVLNPHNSMELMVLFISLLLMRKLSLSEIGSILTHGSRFYLRRPTGPKPAVPRALGDPRPGYRELTLSHLPVSEAAKGPLPTVPTASSWEGVLGTSVVSSPSETMGHRTGAPRLSLGWHRVWLTCTG